MKKHGIRILAGGLALLLLVLAFAEAVEAAAEGETREEATVVTPVAYWSFENVMGKTVSDDAGDHDGTLLGNAEITEGKFGQAVRFSASGDMVKISVTDDLNFTETESYTVSLWVKPEALGGWQCVFNKGGRSENGNNEWIGLWMDGQKFHFGQKSGFTQSTTVTTENGVWSQVVLVQDAAAGKSRIYVNGSLASEKDGCVTADSKAGSYLYLGANNKDGAEPFKGMVDEVKIYAAAMSAEQIASAYQKDSSAAPVAYWSFDDVTGKTVSDDAGDHDGTLLGNAEITEGKFGQAVRFSASGDMVKISVTDDLNFTETESYTVSLWVKPEALGGWQCVFNKGGRSENGNNEWIGLWMSGDKFHFGQDTANSHSQSTTITTKNGSWSHVVLVQDAAAGTSSIYVDGVLASQSNWCVTADSKAGSYLYLGANNKDGAEPFKGMVDEVKIYRRAMSAEQIASAYQKDSSAAPVAYWSFDDVTGETVSDDAGDHDGTLLGNAEITEGKFGQAVRFSASGDMVKISVTDDLNFTETESYTVSLWVKPEALGGWQCVFNKGGRSENGNNEWIGLWMDGQKFHFGQKSGFTQSTTVTTENGVWSQVVLVQDTAAGKSRIYVNGNLASEKDGCVTADSKAGSYLYLGANNKYGAEPFKGMVDEVKIYRRAMEEDEILKTYTALTKEEDEKEEDGEVYAKWTGDFPTIAEAEVTNLILDTDISGDSDDLGALAVLFYYAQKEKVNPLALISCVGGYSAPMLKAIATYYGYPDLPVAARWQSADTHSNYGKYITGHFETSVSDNRDTLSTTALYRKTLAAAADGSVTIVSIGTLANLSDLLNSKADEYSELSGAELVKKKVKILISMGGQFPSGKETNIKNAASAAQNVNTNWQTPIVYSGYEIGYNMMTATRLEEMGMWDNPVSAGYQIYFDYYSGGKTGRPSWDPLTVYFVCAGWDDYYELCRGDMKIDAEGNNTFYENAQTGARAYLKLKTGHTVAEVAALLDQMMVDAVKKNPDEKLYRYADNSDEGITVSGFTLVMTDANSAGKYLYDHSYHLATQAGATLSFTFVGTELLVYGDITPQSGKISVFLDGVQIKTIDLYAQSKRSVCLFSLDGLPLDRHTVTIVSLEEKNAASVGNEVMLDFFKVGLGDPEKDFHVRANVTLAADLRYNLYIQKCALVEKLTLNGAEQELAALPTVVLNDGLTYYRLTVSLAAKDAAERFSLSVTLMSAEGERTADYTFSVPAYAAKIVGNDAYGEQTQNLMKDMLAYIDAAMTYFNTATEEKHNTIASVLGTEYTPADPDTFEWDNAAVSTDTGDVLESACLELGDTPAFVFYLKAGKEDLADSFNFTMNGTPLKVEVKKEVGGKERTYLVVTTYAYGMNDTLTFTYTGGNGSYNLAKYHSGTDASNTDLKTLTVRLAKYANSAKAYKAAAESAR